MYRERIEPTYDDNPSSQPLVVNPEAYHLAVGEPNKGRYYGLRSPLTSVCHLPRQRPRDSHGSTSALHDDVGSSYGPLSHPHIDKHLLYQI